MYYVIQENLFREYGFKALIHRLEREGLEYELVKYVPFSNELNVQTKRKDVFFFGSINGGKVAQSYGWVPGHFINSYFTFEKYLEVYGDHLLNSGNYSNIVMACDMSFWYAFNDDTRYFIRPVTDTKEFTGAVFTVSEWIDYIKGNDSVKDLWVLVSFPKNIQQEIRCWIIDGKMVTSSQYKIGNRVNYLNMDNNEEVRIFSEQMAKIFSPARAYCLDICLHEDEYKIVELGCINHCGFYDANMGKIIDALENMGYA